MTSVVKEKNELMVPQSVQRRARLKPGDEVEFKVSGGIITIVPKLPTADDEYPPEQRRIINTRLAKGLADVKAGRVSRAFDTAEEFIADLHKVSAKLSAKKKIKRAS